MTVSLFGYKLTADDADRVNASTGVGANSDGTFSGPYHEEGQEFPAVKLPTGATLVFVDDAIPLRVASPDETPVAPGA